MSGQPVGLRADADSPPADPEREPGLKTDDHAAPRPHPTPEAPPMMTMQEATDATYAAFGAAIADDLDTAARLITRLTDDVDPDTLFVIHTGIAHAACKVLARSVGPSRAEGLTETGTWSVDMLRPVLADLADETPHAVYALEFIVACANDYTSMAIALYRAAVKRGDQHLVRCTSQLIAFTAKAGATVLEREAVYAG